MGRWNTISTSPLAYENHLQGMNVLCLMRFIHFFDELRGSRVKRRILKNKPLVEAIFEIRWELQELAPGVKRDPHYKVLIGRV
jgi:hypothetical protein